MNVGAVPVGEFLDDLLGILFSVMVDDTTLLGNRKLLRRRSSAMTRIRFFKLRTGAIMPDRSGRSQPRRRCVRKRDLPARRRAATRLSGSAKTPHTGQAGCPPRTRPRRASAGYAM